MAWYDRLGKAASRVASGIGRIISGGRPPPPSDLPSPPSQPFGQSTYEPPYEPVVSPAAPVMGLPAEEPVLPTESGFWQPAGEEPSPIDWTAYEDEFNIRDPLTFDVLEDKYDPGRIMTRDDWYRETLMPADYLRDRYTWADTNQLRPNIEILLQLEMDGYWFDWEDWGDRYEQSI